MAYVNPDTLQEVANILDDFDEATLIDLFKSQIINEESYLSIPINHLEPLYLSYKKAMEIDAAETDDLEEIKSRFQHICISIIQYIQAKFSIEVDLDWIETQYGNLPALTMALYQFFVLELFYVIIGVLNNYISKNINDLSKAFSEVANRKDVSTVTNLKTMDPRYAVIVSSIFDVTDYSFSMLDNEILFDYITPEYIPANIIRGLVERGVITGDFTRRIADIYKDNLELRSKVAVELAYRIKEKGYLQENPIIISSDQIQNRFSGSVNPEAATENYADIDSDVDSQ